MPCLNNTLSLVKGPAKFENLTVSIRVLLSKYGKFQKPHLLAGKIVFRPYPRFGLKVRKQLSPKL